MINNIFVLYECKNANMEVISKSVQEFVDNCRKLVSSQIIESVSNTVLDISNMFSSFNVTEYMTSFKNAFSAFFDALEEARNNPRSFFNFFDYQTKLNAFHWAWPYDITPDELKALLEQATNEQEFDKLMLSFFSKKRVNQMCKYTLPLLPRKHKTIYQQIIEAYNLRQYALINNAIFSIIDNLLSVVLKDKGKTTRKGILQPIIEFYSENYRLADIGFIFELQMLSNNINLIFENYAFSERANIDTHKKARRHLSAHGLQFSNRRYDSIMLLNTITALVDNMIYIEPFNECLSYNKKQKRFFIDTKRYVVVNRIRKKVCIENKERQNK